MKIAGRAMTTATSRRSRKKKSVRRNQLSGGAFVEQAIYRRLAIDPLECRVLLAADMNVRFEVDAPGPVSTLSVDQDFTLKVFVQDVRATPRGILQAYFNLTYDTNVAAVTGPVVNGPDFDVVTSGDDSTPGAIQAAGGLSTTQVPPTPGSLEQLLFSVPMKIVGPGQLNLTPSLATSINPSDTVQLFDSSAEPLSAMNFSGLPLAITSGPAVAFINAADSSTTNASLVHFTVAFNEPVSGVNASDFALVQSGITGSSIASVSPNSGFNTSYIVTVNAGSLTAGTGTLGLNLIDGDPITDSANHVLAGGHSQTTLFSGQTYAIDRTAPAVSSIVTASASASNAASVQYTVTFSKSVTGAAAEDFALTASGVTDASISSVTGSGSTYTVTVNTGSGDGTLGLNLVDGPAKIIDAAGNTLAGGNSGGLLFIGQTYTIRKAPPAVTAITPVSASPTNAATVQFAIAFSEAVMGIGASDFKLVSSGVNGASISSITGSGSSWTVSVATGNGDGTLGLNLIDGPDKIADMAGNFIAGGNTSAILFAGTSAYTIDKTPISVSSIALAQASSTNATSVTYTVTFNKSVSGVTQADFALAASGVTGAAITGIAGSGATYTVTASTGIGNGSLGLNLIDSAAQISDAAGNTLGGGNGGGILFTGESYTIDRTLPTIVSVLPDGASPMNQPSVTFTVTFNENVTGVDATDFTPVVNGITGAQVTDVRGSGATYTVTVSTGTGSGTLGLNVVDGHAITGQNSKVIAGGNTGKVIFAGTPPYTIDKTPITVSSIALAESSPTNRASVDFTVTFNKSVSGVDASDFALVQTGITGASVSGVAGSGVGGSGTTWTVTATTGAGSGTLGLKLVDGGVITDAAGNKLAGGHTGDTIFSSPVSYNVQAPEAQSISVVGLAINVASGTVVTNAQVATFTATGASQSAGSFTASINWGDGSTSSGTVAAVAGGFSVTGSHSYVSPGDRAVKITVTSGGVSQQGFTTATVGSGTELFVAQVYRDLLKREPEPNGLQFWTGLIDGGLSRQAVVAQIELSQEYRDDVVQGLYQLYLHRAAEPAVEASMSNFLLNGTPEQIAAMLVSSNEYFEARGGGTNAGFVAALFNDALNRAPDAAPLQATAPLDLAQQANRAAIAQAVFGSDEYLKDLVSYPGGVTNSFHAQSPFGFFQAYLGRNADATAVQNYFLELKGGRSDADMIAQILASDEYFVRAATQPG